MHAHNTPPIQTNNEAHKKSTQRAHSHAHKLIYTQTFTEYTFVQCVLTCPHIHTALWVPWFATPLSFPCVLSVPSGWRWLMTAMERQIIWVAPSTQDVNQISFANDSQTLIWHPRPEPYRVLNGGTKETSIRPRTILFYHPFQELTSIFSTISRWKRGTSV